MRRFLALVVLLATTAAQASALACPTSHHEETGSAREHHGAHSQPSSDSATSEHGSTGHGTGDHCIMMTSCGFITPPSGRGHSTSIATSPLAAFALTPSGYAAPALARLTPPPRFA